MASRTSGRNDDRGNARNASAPGTSGNTATRGPSSASTNAASRTTNPGSSSANNPANANATSGGTRANASSTRGDQERELHTAREQGATRSTGQQAANIGQLGDDQSSFLGGSSPFALMRRMMEDMDRLFSDFGFTHPGLFSSGLLNQGDLSRQSGRALGSGTSRGSASVLPSSGGHRGLQRSGQSAFPALGSLWSPQVEVFERGNNLVVRADLPGLSKDDVDVEVDNDALVIRGERHNDFEDEQAGYYRSERSYGSFYRAIPLPEGIDAEACNASFKDGVLEVTLPKPPQQRSQAKKIDVR